MTRMNITSLIIGLVFLQVCHSYKRVCYYTNWAQYRANNGKFFPENMDPNLCTHIVFAFAKMNGNRLVSFEWNDESTDWMRGMYAKFNDIKLKNPTIKTLLAVGGWNMGSEPFTKMVVSAENRAEFAKSTIQFLRERNFDGLDLDWEYPANRGSPSKDKGRYTQLVIQLRSAFNQEAAVTGKTPLLLTSAVAAGKETIDTGYEIATISRHMDFINVMTYDLHGPWEKFTGHNSPLYARKGETEPDTQLNIAWAAEYWHRNGLPKEKLNVGLALYGRSFTLKDPYNNGLGAPAKGKGTAGNYTGEAGFLSYYEVCQKIAEGAQRHYIPEQMSPYITYADQWVGYDDMESLAIKVKYIKDQKYGGIMVWALDLDDFNFICNTTTETFPLLKRINHELGITIPQGSSSVNRISPSQSKPEVRVQTSKPKMPQASKPKWFRPKPEPKRTPATARPPSGGGSGSKPPRPSPKPSGDKKFKCEVGGDGYYPSPYSCKEYYMCNDGHAHHFKCASGLLFNSQFNYCGWPKDVVCDLDAARKKANQSLVNQPKPTPPKPKKPIRTTPQPVYDPVPENRNAFQFKPNVPQHQQPVQKQQVVKQKQQQAPTQPIVPPQQPRRNVQQQQPPRPMPQNQPGAMDHVASNDPWNWSPFQDQQQNTLPFYWSLFRTDLSRDGCTGKANGLYVDPDNCQGFLECNNEISFFGLCGAGMAFDSQRHVCDYQQNVPGCLQTGHN